MNNKESECLIMHPHYVRSLGLITIIISHKSVFDTFDYLLR